MVSHGVGRVGAEVKMIAASFPLFDAFLTILWVALLALWIWTLVAVVVDLIRSDLAGWQKAAWFLFVLIFPLLGMLVYLIARGPGMAARAGHRSWIDAERLERRLREDGRARDRFSARDRTGGADSTEDPRIAADRLIKLSELREHGDISDEEFQRLKARLLA